MEIVFLGHAAFEIKTKNSTLIIDPFDPQFVGMPWNPSEADVVCITHDHQDHNFIQGVKGEPFVIAGPGEYEVKGVLIFGLAAFHDKKQGDEKGLMTLYRIEDGEVALAHLGNLGHKLEEDTLEQLEGVDILLIPVDGVGSIGPKEAVEISRHLSPSIVVPMHYRVPGTKTEEWGFAPVEKFLAEMGVEEAERVEKLKIKSKSELEEEMKVILMSKPK